MMRQLPPIVRRIGVSAVLVAAAVLSTGAAAAPAAPSDCKVFPDDRGVDVECDRGTGEYRASTRCDKNNWPDYNRYGSWERVPHRSVVNCNYGDRAYNQGYQTR